MNWANIVPIVIGAGIGLIVSILMSLIQHGLSVRKEYSRRLWELKRESYSQIVASLVDMQYLLDLAQTAWMLNKESPTESGQVGKNEFLDAKKLIVKTTMAGEFLVSAQTIDALEALLRDLDQRNPNLYEEIDQHWDAVRDCVTRIRQYAKTDLHRTRRKPWT